MWSYRPGKANSNQTRLIAGGNRVNYSGNYITPTIDLLTVELYLDSTIAIVGVRFKTIDIKYFNLNTPMTRYKYMCLKINEPPRQPH